MNEEQEQVQKLVTLKQYFESGLIPSKELYEAAVAKELGISQGIYIRFFVSCKSYREIRTTLEIVLYFESKRLVSKNTKK
jgi:hypothetical protein